MMEPGVRFRFWRLDKLLSTDVDTAGNVETTVWFAGVGFVWM